MYIDSKSRVLNHNVAKYWQYNQKMSGIFAMLLILQNPIFLQIDDYLSTYSTIKST